jgi:hypothetical protein
MEFAIGLGGFPQKPKQKRWYTCLMGNEGWSCMETSEYKINPFADKYASVPDSLPRFLDKYVIRLAFSDGIPVSIHSKSQGTSQTARPTPSEQHLESPSVRRVPSVAYTGAHKQPKNPFQ